MNLIVTVTLANGQTLASCRMLYYSAQDETILWRWAGDSAQIIARHAGSPEQYRLPGRNTFSWPADGSGVVRYYEHGCACGHAFKSYSPPHPDALGAAWREVAR
jgi:hypothetical protein